VTLERSWLLLRIHCSRGLRGCGRRRCRPRHCSSQRKRDGMITFLLPSCFLTLSRFRFSPRLPAPAASKVRKNLTVGCALSVIKPGVLVSARPDTPTSRRTCPTIHTTMFSLTFADLKVCASRAAPPHGSPSESLIEGGVASTIPLKQNHIPALIVSTLGFGLAPCRGRRGDRPAALRAACMEGPVYL
jgi:hypothetical protein